MKNSEKNVAVYPELIFDEAAWEYDSANDVYYKLGICYCSKPETLDYETLAIYIPGAYLKGEKNKAGHYSCITNSYGKVNGFNAKSAPIVIPLDTPTYIAMEAQKEYDYDTAAKFLKEGFIYVHAGCRGRDNVYDEKGELKFSSGAPWGVTDIKAAIRYLRYNGAAIPGDLNKIFVFGFSAGGAQSTILGSTGDSPLYFDYLNSIGAAMKDDSGIELSDSVAGVMAWCPVHSLGIASEAYEWNMGQYSNADTRKPGTWTAQLSSDMATEFAKYINGLGLTDKNENPLLLKESEKGIFAQGSYYDYLMGVVNESLNNYLADNGINTEEKITRYLADLNGQSIASSKLNAPLETDFWICYDTDENKAFVTSMEALAKYWKLPELPAGAFDQLNGQWMRNRVFAEDHADYHHFDAVMAGLISRHNDTYSQLADWEDAFVEDYQEVFNVKDKLGKTIIEREQMYDPIYFLSPNQKEYRKSTVAGKWRIRSGMTQITTALTTEVNLALLLEQYGGIDVDFAVVWDQEHVEAERTGEFLENFIEWVKKCS